MSKTIHIHVHHKPTRDAGEWEESKHPRAENGQFGKGSGGGAAAKKSAGSSKPLHVQRQEKLDAEKAAKANPHLHNHLGSGDPKPSNGEATKTVRRMDHNGAKSHAVAAGAKSATQVQAYSTAAAAHEAASAQAGQKGGAFVLNHPDHDYHLVTMGANAQRMEKNGYKIVSPSNRQAELREMGSPQQKAAPVRAPERTPMRQAMRKQEAAGIKEARRVMKQPDTYNIEGQKQATRSIAAMQSEATLADVLARIRARKK